MAQREKPMIRCMRRKTIVLALVVVGFATTAATQSPARAALTCPGQRYVQPFLPWLDPGNYVLLQNGSLESDSGWQLADGARLVAGNEQWRVNSPTDSRSLYLPSGASATSPALCVTLLHPTLRFFAMNSGASGVLKVEAITVVLGIRVSVPVGFMTARGWQPTVPLAFLTNVASPLTGAVSFRFTTLGTGGKFQIDDVYVDPFKGR
jgi:hypothetical protein